jgi:hypothetical protein
MGIANQQIALSEFLTEESNLSQSSTKESLSVISKVFE